MPAPLLALAPPVPTFDRSAAARAEPFARIGGGSLGAKAAGLWRIRDGLGDTMAPPLQPHFRLEIPRSIALGTDLFDLFLERNGLRAEALCALDDERIVQQVVAAELPAELLAELPALLGALRTPLAIRSSSLLEDDWREPLAGVYATHMIPNHHPELGTRLGQLGRAVKQVYASTFLSPATVFRRATGRSAGDEKMAVLIQEVVGTGKNGRFYPHISGVARSASFYPLGIAKPSDGTVSLALGLGRIIVDEGIAWTYSPACPQANPPYGTPRELVEQTQSEFWAIDLGAQAPARGAAPELEYLGRHSLGDAERDQTLAWLASTYDADNDRIVAGLGVPGPRLLDFAPILKAGCLPLNALLQQLLRRCEQQLGTLVELEFAVTMAPGGAAPARFGLLQVRPMLASSAEVTVTPHELRGAGVLLASEAALGNGRLTTVQDIVYVEPTRFDPHATGELAYELEAVNQRLVAAHCPYLLIGFGRWGSSDPSAGIPVTFGQISGAKVLVEATLPNMDHRHSQGIHFFHNLTSFEVLYFPVHHGGPHRIDWSWLQRQRATSTPGRVRHVKLAAPLEIKVDGRVGRGVIIHG